MDIDIERLATDLEYWNKVAPEGAECFIGVHRFVKWAEGVELTWDEPGGRGWIAAAMPWTLEKYMQRLGGIVTMKPTPPAWNGEGFPPVGTVCEKTPSWHKCEIIAKHDGGVIVYDMHNFSYYKVVIMMSFRPIRTTEQIQRDKLRALIEDAYMSKPRGHDGGLDAVAEAVLDKYTLEPKA